MQDQAVAQLLDIVGEVRVRDGVPGRLDRGGDHIAVRRRVAGIEVECGDGDVGRHVRPLRIG